MKVLPVSLLGALVALFGCSRSAPGGGSASSEPVVKVTAVVARTESAPVDIEVTGTVRPVERAQLAARIMGTIEEMPIALGQAVRRGDVLVRISAAEIDARVVQAQSQLNVARRDLERERELLPKGASTAETVRSLEDRFTGAAAMLREAEVMQGYATIRAPFDGVVARKLAHVGDLAAPGFPLLELEGQGGFEIEAGVPDSVSGSLVTGAVIAVETAAGSLEGRLAELSSSADPNAHTVPVKIAVPSDAGLRSGQFTRIHLPGPAVPMLLVPAAAVTRRGQMERVFVAEDRRAVLRLVKTGARRGDRVEILAGVDAGDRVVVSPPAGLCEGQRLEIQP